MSRGRRQHPVAGRSRMRWERPGLAVCFRREDPMPTDKQIKANRRNAQASTGPRTAAGKARSSQNALTHGLTARAGLLPGEDPEAFRQFRARLFTELRPEGAIEGELAKQVAWPRGGCDASPASKQRFWPGSAPARTTPVSRLLIFPALLGKGSAAAPKLKNRGSSLSLARPSKLFSSSATAICSAATRRACSGAYPPL